MRIGATTSCRTACRRRSATCRRSACGRDWKCRSINASATLPVNTGEKLIAYVLTNACYPPREIMLEYKDPTANWKFAYWGEDLVNYSPRTRIGDLPQSGAWIRLEIPASTLGY